MMEMPEASPSRSRGLIALIIVGLLVTSAAASYELGAAAANQAADAREQRLQALINSLMNQNSDLQNQLASGNPARNVTILGLNPVKIYSDSAPSIVTVEGVQVSGSGNTSVLGSGFVALFQGKYYIVTNFHVVHNVEDISITFFDGDSYPGTVLGIDPYVDLAVLSINAPKSELVPLQIGRSSQLQVGQPVVAIGNPFGLAGSMTFGIVSQMGRTLSETLAGNFAIADVIQFSAPINPGNSGGPLFDASGSVVGITTATITSSQGVGFAIPSDAIARELPSLILTGGYTQHSLMGVVGVDMTLQLARLQHTNVTYGFLIQNITAGGPADRAGLRGGNRSVNVQGTQYAIGGDIVVGLNGTKIVGTDALSSYLQEFTLPGQTLLVHIIRNGSPGTITLILGTRPAPPS